MKKTNKRFVLALICALMFSMLLTSCSSKPKPEDAKAYVQAILDFMCTGEHDESVQFSDVEEGKETEIREQIFDTYIDTINSEIQLSEENESKFREVLDRAFHTAKYNVGDAVETEDGGYDVTVSIEPLKIFRGMSDNLEDRMMAQIKENPEKFLNMSDDEVNNYVLNMVVDMMNENLDDPQYDAPVELTVHYGLLDEDNNEYGCSEEDGKRMGEQIFSLDGVE